MKHYIGKIVEVNGDMEYDTKYLFATGGNPDKYSKRVARDWRGCSNSDWDKNDGGYWSDCTLVCDDGSREIPEEDFKVLSKYLAVL